MVGTKVGDERKASIISVDFGSVPNMKDMTFNGRHVLTSGMTISIDLNLLELKTLGELGVQSLAEAIDGSQQLDLVLGDARVAEELIRQPSKIPKEWEQVGKIFFPVPMGAHQGNQALWVRFLERISLMGVQTWSQGMHRVSDPIGEGSCIATCPRELWRGPII